MTSWGPGHIDLVALGPDCAIHQKRLLNGHWDANWTNLGGNFVYKPAVVSIRPGSLNIFAISDNGKFYNKWWDNGWFPAQGWEELSGPDPFMEKPVAISTALNTVNVFAIDKSRRLMMKTWNGSHWSDFVSLGGVLPSAPAVVSTGAGKLDIFSVGTESSLYHKWFDGKNWGPTSIDGAWENMGQQVVGEVRAMTRPGDKTGIVDVFGVGMDSAIWYKSGHGGAGSWGPGSQPAWRSLGSISRGSPSVIAMSPQSLQVFITGPNSIIHHLWSLDGGATWSPEDMGGLAVQEAAAVSMDPSRMDLFIVTLDGSTLHKTYTVNSWTPSLTGYENLGGLSVSGIATK